MLNPEKKYRRPFFQIDRHLEIHLHLGNQLHRHRHHHRHRHRRHLPNLRLMNCLHLEETYLATMNYFVISWYLLQNYYH